MARMSCIESQTIGLSCNLPVSANGVRVRVLLRVD